MDNLPEILLKIMEEKCYELYNVTNTTIITDDDRFICRAVFDGLYCWPHTEAGDLAVQPCTNNLLKSTKQVSKTLV